MRVRAPARGRYPRRFFQREGVPYATDRSRRVSVRGRLQRPSLEFTNVAHERKRGAGVKQRREAARRCRSAVLTPRSSRFRPLPQRGLSRVQRPTSADSPGLLTAEVNGELRSTGKFTFIAANGDQLSGTFVGEGVFMPPNTVTRTEKSDDRERNRPIRGSHWHVYDGDGRHDRFCQRRQGDWIWILRRTDQPERMSGGPAAMSRPVGPPFKEAGINRDGTR